MDVIIGVDGGGTKTSIAAIDMTGMWLLQVEGSINYNFISKEEAVCNLVDAVNSLICLTVPICLLVHWQSVY